MSGQSLIDVVSTVVQSMSRSPTIDDEIREFVYLVHSECTRTNVALNIVWKEQIRSERCNPVLKRILKARAPIVLEYLREMERVTLPSTFELDDTTSLKVEITAFQAFLDRHCNTPIETFAQMGMRPSNLNILFRRRNSRVDVMYIRHYLEFWNMSRAIEGRPVVSVGVYYQMSTLMTGFFKSFHKKQISLTEAEFYRVVDDALEQKRRTVLGMKAQANAMIEL
jgi:hypothetical protein